MPVTAVPVMRHSLPLLSPFPSSPFPHDSPPNPATTLALQQVHLRDARPRRSPGWSSVGCLLVNPLRRRGRTPAERHLLPDPRRLCRLQLRGRIPAGDLQREAPHTPLHARERHTSGAAQVCIPRPARCNSAGGGAAGNEAGHGPRPNGDCCHGWRGAAGAGRGAGSHRGARRWADLGWAASSLVPAGGDRDATRTVMKSIDFPPLFVECSIVYTLYMCSKPVLARPRACDFTFYGTLPPLLFQ